jgi:hypothetical protein
MVPTQSAKPVCTTLNASAGMAASRSSETKAPSERVSVSDMGALLLGSQRPRWHFRARARFRLLRFGVNYRAAPANAID